MRPGMTAQQVLDEDAVVKDLLGPRCPRLGRQELAQYLRNGEQLAGATFAEPLPILTVRTR